MSAYQFERYAERRESELWKDYSNGIISREEYNAEMRELQREGRDAYEHEMEDAQAAVRDEWGW